MKYIKIILLIVLIISITEKGNAQSGITNSLHNFSSASWNQWGSNGLGGTSATSTSGRIGGQICAPCHAPHVYTSNVSPGSSVIGPLTGAPSNAPLWSHQLSATTSYLTYSGYNMDSTAKAQAAGGPVGTSKLCLSCHDGTVSMNYYRTFSASTSGIKPILMSAINNGVSNLGIDLSNDHPISFVYDQGLSQRTNNGVYDPTSHASGIILGGSATNGTIQSDLLEGGTLLQCTSCHDPHNGAGAPHMLVKSNTASALCLTCHNK